MRRSGPAVEQLIGALIPQPLPRPIPTPAPLPTLPPPRAPTGPDRIELDVARLDRAGRCSARKLLHQLDWHPEHRLVVDVADGTILIQRHPGGRVLTDPRGALTLPAAARQLCGICGGDRIVLAGDLTRDRITVYPMAIVARLLTEHHTRLTDGHHGH
ncbi:hypothetical protein [Dactylosporangium sp. NPDC050588]|uniref:hypothetical protein n=1 Tax=Dactylosporangium sp. NPDC050588 TaxID=3157211 RepID=UPI0033F23CE4